MRIEDLTVALRPRTAWEAVELGTALVRRHAGAVWTPWLLVSLPMLLLVNALCWQLGVVWLAGLVMWWLKPLFDRIPLYVLSRAVFGHVPTPRETVRAQWSFGRRWLPAYLLWRRLGPVRAVYLPVDLLEGGVGEEARARRRALGSPVYGVASLVLLVFAHFEVALLLGAVSTVMLFAPNDLVQETAARMWNVFESQQDWVQFTSNLLMWAATSVLEPFYVGAGFGLYLNRRTEIEAWDIEMVLRRLRARLGHAVAPLLLLCALGLGVLPARAQQEEPFVQETPAPPATDVAARQVPRAESTLREVFGPQVVDDDGWRQAVKRTYEDPAVSPRRTVTQWVPKNPDSPRPPADFGRLGEWLASIGEYGLWIVVGALVLALLLTAPKWLGWIRDPERRRGRDHDEVQREAVAEESPLPEDVPAAARRLWQAGRERDALALVYRASVEAMTRRAQVVLVPGATEAHTLRASRQLSAAADREAFARVVRVWQTAAYAHGLPAGEEFEDLLTQLAQRFWAGAAA
ncbi:hypothetical protein J2X04_002420 [Lysobacter niabensis]|uniref:DUF4129 domain-containing protein n=1 Tax=Agrilutibacter niabensis TaxID=380628 RepID=A0ABU1VRB6_9GAMM|nr:DUF4129 domain-containing protein [Lysobacter niabensis]MDR7100039.1 hypothetical protein [Lysobacter niabensis]